MATKSLKELMAEKIVKASNTNGLKRGILNIIMDECLKRKFNKFEAINAINAIGRTKFYIKLGPPYLPKKGFKYRTVREIQNECNSNATYKIEYLQGILIFYTY